MDQACHPKDSGRPDGGMTNEKRVPFSGLLTVQQIASLHTRQRPGIGKALKLLEARNKEKCRVTWSLKVLPHIHEISGSGLHEKPDQVAPLDELCSIRKG